MTSFNVFSGKVDKEETRPRKCLYMWIDDANDGYYNIWIGGHSFTVNDKGVNKFCEFLENVSKNCREMVIHYDAFGACTDFIADEFSKTHTNLAISSGSIFLVHNVPIKHLTKLADFLRKELKSFRE